jgi:hypothetical protein
VRHVRRPFGAPRPKPQWSLPSKKNAWEGIILPKLQAMTDRQTFNHVFSRARCLSDDGTTVVLVVANAHHEGLIRGQAAFRAALAEAHRRVKFVEVDAL